MIETIIETIGALRVILILLLGVGVGFIGYIIGWFVGFNNCSKIWNPKYRKGG